MEQAITHAIYAYLAVSAIGLVFFLVVAVFLFKRFGGFFRRPRR